MADNGIDTFHSPLKFIYFDLFLSHFLLLFDEVSLDQLLAAAIDAAQKAGEVSLSFSLEFDQSSG